MAAKSQTDAFNQQLGFLDNTVQGQTQDAWYNFLKQNQQASQAISGLQSPWSNELASKGFDQGLEDYTANVNGMIANPGYTDQEKQGQRVATAAGFAAPYADAQNQMKLQQQRTGNSAGVNNSIAKVGREKGQAISAGLGGLEKGFGDARIADLQNAMSLSQFPQMARLQRMQGERDTAGLGLQAAGQNQGAYGTGLQAQLGTVGLRGSNIANNPSFMKQLGSGLASGFTGSLFKGSE